MSFILKEDGDKILQENGDRILLEVLERHYRSVNKYLKKVNKYLKRDDYEIPLQK